jgi:hypothetical protein
MQELVNCMGSVEPHASERIGMNFEKIAERKLWLADETNGGHADLRVEIGRPQWTEVNVEASCEVFIHGLMNSALNIYGSDLFNALECALGFVNSELKNITFPKKVLWPGGESYFD